MAVAGVRAFLCVAEELSRGDEAGSGCHFLMQAAVALRVAEDRVVHVAGFADDKREFRVSKLRAHIGDEVHQIAFVLGGSFFIAAIVPALEPNDTIEARRVASKRGELRGDGGHGGAVLGDHLLVIRSDLAA